MAYETRCLDRLIETRDALNDRTWRPSRTLAFVVDKPKAREIHAADFGDRVVHHWLVPRLEVWFEPVFIHDSYSNRRGKGTHAVVDRLQDFVRQASRNGKIKAYYLQLDIANFFNSIDREILYGLIRHRAERVWRVEKSIAAKAAPTEAGAGFVGAGLPANAGGRIAAKAAPTGSSQPNRVPMGIFPNGAGQARAHGVGDDVARDMLQIFPIAQGMVMEARLPDRHAGRAAAPVDGAAASGFEAPEQIGKRGAAQLQQPMQMIGHHHEGEGVAQTSLIASAQFPYRQSGQTQIGEQGQAISRDRGDEIPPPDFRDAANAQTATVGMCCHVDNHDRNNGAVGAGLPAIDAIAGKPAPTGGGGFVAPIAEQCHAEINFCLWLCRTLLDHDAGAYAIERGPAQSFSKVPARKRLKNAPAGIGLPIGNLTSQFFANIYLDRLDQFVKHELKCRHYLRYVDDFVLVHEDPLQLLAWRDAIESFLAQSLALRFKALSEPKPVGGGIDFLGYVVRRTYLLPRRRVLRQAQARLAGFAAELVRPLSVDGIAGKPAPTTLVGGGIAGKPAPTTLVGGGIAGKPAPTGGGDGFVGGGSPPINSWVIRWSPDVRERLRASWASTFGHLSQAASRRQALALWQRHPWAHSAFAFDAGRFRLYNRFEPPSVASYAGQKRWFARRFPACIVLLQKGWEYELVGANGQIAGSKKGIQGTRPAPTIFPASHLPRLIASLHRAGQAYVIVREEGYLKLGLKRRVLSEIGWSRPSHAPC